MKDILIILGIWAIIAFIYAKVKNMGFWESFFYLPVKILGAIFRNSAKQSSFKDAERMAKKQGRDDIIDNINNARDACNAAADAMDNMASHIKKE